MSKVFYLSLIAMMTTVIGSLLSAYQFYDFWMKQTAKELLFDFWILELSYIACSLLVSAVFFIYRFCEFIIWPIVSTIIQIVYFAYVWTTIFNFYENPVGFISAKREVWNGYTNMTKQEVYSQYKCKGFVSEDLSVTDRVTYMPCSRSIYRKLGSELLSHASNQFTMSFIHVASMISIWLTHFMGGIEFDQTPENVSPSAAQHQYTQI